MSKFSRTVIHLRILISLLDSCPIRVDVQMNLRAIMMPTLFITMDVTTQNSHTIAMAIA